MMDIVAVQRSTNQPHPASFWHACRILGGWGSLVAYLLRLAEHTDQLVSEVGIVAVCLDKRPPFADRGVVSYGDTAVVVARPLQRFLGAGMIMFALIR